MVAVILASTRVRVASKTEPSHTVSVRPAWMTLPRDHAIRLRRLEEIDLEFDGQHFAVAGNPDSAA